MSDKWTTKIPIQRGWYWAYENLDPLDADILCVYVCNNIVYSQGVVFSLKHFSHWMGPLSKPRPPK